VHLFESPKKFLSLKVLINISYRNRFFLKIPKTFEKSRNIKSIRNNTMLDGRVFTEPLAMTYDHPN
jgi:hypothetical protein